jgi:Caspase domain
MFDRTVCCIGLFSLIFLKAAPVTGQCSPESINGQHRTALVIGVGDYTHEPKLSNPANDARDISTSLDHLHFHPKKFIDDKAKDLRKHIEEWTNSIPPNCDIALFYFAGHAVQGTVNKENYLFPTDGNGISDALLEGTTYKVSEVLSRMKASGAKLNVLILDACRLPPEPRGLKNSLFRKGMATMNPTGNGTLICFSTEAGKASSDGPRDGHSEYTQALLEYFEVPGLHILKMLERVHDRVFADKGLDQNPCIYSSVGEDFDFCLSPAEEISKSDGTEPAIVSGDEVMRTQNTSSNLEIDRLFKFAVDSITTFINNERSSICRESGNEIEARSGSSRSDIDHYFVMDHFALIARMSTTRILVPRITLSLDGITFKFQLISANKDWLQTNEPDLLRRYEFLHNLDTGYTREYSIYAIRWVELYDLIRDYYRKRLQVLQKNGVPEPAKSVTQADTFAMKKISEFRSAVNNPEKIKERNDRKLFDALYRTFETVAKGIKDSLGNDFEYHEDDVQKDYRAHTFYYGIGIRSVDIQDKWLVPIFMGGIRNDSLYFVICTYANPRLSAWEKGHGLPHEESTQVALSELNWDDLTRQTQKFIAARLEILK